MLFSNVEFEIESCKGWITRSDPPIDPPTPSEPLDEDPAADELNTSDRKLTSSISFTEMLPPPSPAADPTKRELSKLIIDEPVEDCEKKASPPRPTDVDKAEFPPNIQA
jgi:hypothetical protein